MSDEKTKKPVELYLSPENAEFIQKVSENTRDEFVDSIITNFIEEINRKRNEAYHNERIRKAWEDFMNELNKT